ncbi:hypothetical protein M8J77_011339 [Diaphorina citri]|nr:hypothetical protein M8J77_011339 [Diaphorina citri]
MSMKHVSIDQLKVLQYNTNNIRNICILAHVDHGKTTLADCLIASNGIISSKMAGKLRYMDSRKDEQERGITMKSSSISLYYKDNKDTPEEYLINLIDSPGHVDFSSEVSTAVRLCDGTIIVVDCVEGICAQTQVALKQAWLEKIQPILVLNKIDRLILEMKLSPLDIYVHLSQLLEQVNAVMGELFASQVMDETAVKTTVQDNETKQTSNRGNVVFASAFDGWGFTIDDFARLYSAKLGIREDILRKTLWGDYYLNAKAKRILKGAQEKTKAPLFVEFVLKNVVTLYETVAVRKDKEKLGKIVDSLGVKLTLRDLRHTDPRVQIQAVMSQWLPLSNAVLQMICAHCPAPNQLSSEKVEKLLSTSHVPYGKLPPDSKHLKTAFLECRSDGERPLVVFISKMFPVERKHLPENRQRPLTREEMTARREMAKSRLAARAQEFATNQESDTSSATPTDKSIEPRTSDQTAEEDKPDTPAEPEDAFIAFARVYSGTLKKGDTVYVLGPKHDPSLVLDKLAAGEDLNLDGKTLKDLKSGCHVTRVTLNQIYLLMGRELCELDQVPAGNMLGIGGLEDHVLKSATLSSVLACPSFSELHLMATPILRVALEPVHPGDLATLVRGLRLLNQADACVEVILQESGEHVLVTAGEVHLQRCLDDLRERYAKVDISVSEPIVPFRETVIPPPLVDMTNESIVPTQHEKKDDNSSESHQWVIVHTQDHSYQFKIQAIPLPDKITQVLDNNLAVFKAFHRDTRTRKITDLESSVKNLSLANDSDHSSNNLQDSSTANPSSDKAQDSTKLEDHINNANNIRDSIQDSTNKDNIQGSTKIKDNIQGSTANKDHLQDSTESEDHINDSSNKDNTQDASLIKDMLRIRNELRLILRENPAESLNEEDLDRIVSFGPRYCGPNVLINCIPDLDYCLWPDSNRSTPSKDERLEHFNSVINGFQLATLAGPLCEEPMMGVGFKLLEWMRSDSLTNQNTFYGPLSGQIMATIKEGCRKAFQIQPQRLMAAMYTCNIQVSSEVLAEEGSDEFKPIRAESNKLGPSLREFFSP